MRRSVKRVLRSCLFITALVSSSAIGFAQLNSTVSNVTLTATLAESLTVSATPTTVTFTLVAGGTANGSAPVAMTTTWVLSASRANVVLVGFFTTAASALTNGSVNIPSSEVYGTVATGTPTTATAFTQSGVVGTASAGLTMFTQALTSSNRSSTRTDNLALQINLTAQPQLPASTYTGTLNLEAQAL
jgi:hypothetical protein